MDYLSDITKGDLSTMKYSSNHLKRNRIISLYLLITMFTGLFFTNSTAFAAEKNTNHPVLAAGEYWGYSKYGEGLYSYPLYIWDGQEERVAYCYNATLAWPPPDTALQDGYYSIFTKSDFSLEDSAAIMKVIYNGYPYNQSGLQENYNLASIQFRAVTQAAVWKYTDDLSLSKAKYKLTQRTSFVWTENMDSAYSRLISINNTGLVSPPEDFTLDLFTTINDFPALPVQQLLSTRMKSHENFPQTLPIYPATTTLRASKTMDGIAANGNAFFFQLSDASGNVLQTKTNTGSDIIFDPIDYTSEGTYEYTIHEIAGEDASINYDTAVYKARVIVTNTGSNVLSAETSYYIGEEALDAEPVFKNTTKPPVSEPSAPNPPDTGDSPDADDFFDVEDFDIIDIPEEDVALSPQTGDSFNPELLLVLLAASLMGLVIILVSRRKKNKHIK